MPTREPGIETNCLHAGHSPDSETNARAVPIYQTTSFVFDDAQHAADLFNLKVVGNIYSRLSNPTVAVLEQRVAALEGGKMAVATASGMSAQMSVILTLLDTGDEIVSSSTLYGGTYIQLSESLKRLGIKTVFVNPDNPENFRKAITEKTKMVFAETISNPLVNVIDVEAIANIAHAAGLPLFIDNTVPTPYLCRPIEYGADVILHSATKFLGGHGNSIGGVMVDSGNFPWDNGKFPTMIEPSESYHGMRFYETFGHIAFAVKVRCEALRSLGACLSPFNAFLILQGIETLPLRMQRHVENTQKVAQFLQDHASVSWVNYAGLKDSKYYELARKYTPKGPGAVLSFGIKGGVEAGIKFINSCNLLSHLANIGDSKTLVIHPASTTHRQLNKSEQSDAGVGPDMVRISVGLESIEDIIFDIDQALSKSQ